jgi:hypothetical protein
MQGPIDITSLTPFAALVVLGYLVFRYLTQQAERKDAFTEKVATQAMNGAEAARRETKKIVEALIDVVNGSTQANKELTDAIRERDEVTQRRLAEIAETAHDMVEAQIEHEDESAKRHKVLEKHEGETVRRYEALLTKKP